MEPGLNFLALTCVLYLYEEASVQHLPSMRSGFPWEPEYEKVPCVQEERSSVQSTAGEDEEKPSVLSQNRHLVGNSAKLTSTVMD
jgi:hypothetical protein